MWTIAGHWSYSGDPSTSDRDQVRFLIGDTDREDQLVSDEEIDWSVSTQSDTYAAGSVICDHISSRFSREADKSVSANPGQSITHHLSQRSVAFRTRAKQLLSTSASYSVLIPLCGGISVADKEAVADDSDRVRPAFERDQFGNMGTSTSRNEI